MVDQATALMALLLRQEEGGNGFAGTFTQESGVIDAVHITNSGEYYATNPTVIIDGDGNGGEIVASANPGQPTEPEITGTGYYPLYTDNILGSGFFAASGQVTGQADCFSLALEVSGKYEFEHQEMLNLLSGPDWTPTGMPF